MLHTYASDEAIARGPSPPPNLPPMANLATVYTDIKVGASFTDFLTVHAAGLAAGAEVQLPFVFMAEFLTNSRFFAPEFSAQSMTVSGVFSIPGIGPQTFTTAPFRNSFQSTLLPSGLYLQHLQSRPFSVTVHVGDVLPIGVTFGISGQAQITDTNRLTELGTFADGRNTAALWLGSLADGVTVTSASGHDYTIDPTAVAVIGAVPEPQTYGLMLAGLAWIGYVSRRRARTKSASHRRRALEIGASPGVPKTEPIQAVHFGPRSLSDSGRLLCSEALSRAAARSWTSAGPCMAKENRSRPSRLAA